MTASLAYLVTIAAALAVAGAALDAKQPALPILVVHVARVNTEEAIEAAFVARSDPNSHLFRKHLTQKQLTELVQAKPESLEAVTSYLNARGCVNVRMLRTRDALKCVVPARSQLANDIGARKTPALRTAFRVPDAMAAHVRQAIIAWPRQWMAGAAPKPRRPAVPGMVQKPSTIFARYAVPTTAPTVVPQGVTQGVAEFQGEYFVESDMSFFMDHYKFQNVSIQIMGPNPTNTGNDQTEGTLDLQYMAAMTQGAITTWWLAQDTNNDDPNGIDFTLWADSVLGLNNMPAVVSISWGMGYENYDSDMQVLTSDNDAFRKMGLGGISVFAASGDSGPGNRGTVFDCTTFIPGWPASSQYVTSVGATYATSMTAPEVAIDWSGGGFSTFFARPAYQKEALDMYFRVAENTLPNATFYNASGRGYPDVAALGANFEVYVGGSFETVSGTSCAAPTFAGIIARIVAERVARGEPTFGFLNPKLYSLKKVGFDVTQGASKFTNCNPSVPLPGFPAASGWDAVTGLGTPDFEFLRRQL